MNYGLLNASPKVFCRRYLGAELPPDKKNFIVKLIKRVKHHLTGVKSISA